MLDAAEPDPAAVASSDGALTEVPDLASVLDAGGASEQLYALGDTNRVVNPASIWRERRFVVPSGEL